MARERCLIYIFYLVKSDIIIIIIIIELNKIYFFANICINFSIEF